MPLKTFWLLHKNIDRIEAGDDYRQLQTIISATHEDGVRAHSERLLGIVGLIVDYDRGTAVMTIDEEEHDQAGIEWLRMASGRKKHVTDPR